MQSTLTKAAIRELAPAALAMHPAKRVSPKYHFYPTHQIIDALASENWAVIEATTAHSRNNTIPVQYRKHELAFADRDILARKHKLEEIPRIMLVNSHDANCACRMYAGLYRFICSNGMRISDGVIQSVRIPHTRQTIEEVILAAQAFRANSEKIGQHVEAFKARELTGPEIRQFSRWAIQLRQPQKSDTVIAPDDILAIQRSEDVGADLWHVFNRVQEHLLKGGFPVYQHTDTGWIERSARPIKGIDQRSQLNAGLWDLAERFVAG